MKEKLVVSGITNELDLICLTRTRGYTQYKRMVEDILANRCPFCEVDREYNKVEAENTYWYAFKCNPPRKNTRLHFLFVPKRHVLGTRELNDEEILSLFNIKRVVQDKNGYRSCGTMVRDEDARNSAGSLAHLHIHDVVPSGTGLVEFPFYNSPEIEEINEKRAIVFEKLRRLSKQIHSDDPSILLACADLSPEETALIEGRMD